MAVRSCMQFATMNDFLQIVKFVVILTNVANTNSTFFVYRNNWIKGPILCKLKPILFLFYCWHLQLKSLGEKNGSFAVVPKKNLFLYLLNFNTLSILSFRGPYILYIYNTYIDIHGEADSPECKWSRRASLIKICAKRICKPACYTFYVISQCNLCQETRCLPAMQDATKVTQGA